MWRYDWGVNAGGCSFPDLHYHYFTHICSEITPHGYFTVPPWILTKTVHRYFVKSHTQEDTNCSVTWQIAAHLCYSTSFGHQCFHSECHFYLILSLLSNSWLLNEICQNIHVCQVISHLPHSQQILLSFLGFPRSSWCGTPNMSICSFHKMKNQIIKIHIHPTNWSSHIKAAIWIHFNALYMIINTSNPFRFN